jgi:transposase
LYYKAGIKLIYLPLYSPDLNLIKEFFAELKAFIKRSWQNYKENPKQRFDAFLKWCIDIVEGRERSARGYFWYVRLTIKKL